MSTPIILLAGGKSSRMGRDKTRLEFRGETLLDRALRRFSEHFDTVLVSVAAIPPLGDATLLPDLLPNLGPLSGLHAALSRFDSAFLVAADMPLAEPELASLIIAAGTGYDACAATSDGHTEPTFAYYSRAVFPELLAAIDRGDYSLHRLLSRVNANYVEIPAETLLNINWPDDYEKLLSGD
ncbi:MAG: molybdenum cofactor guanylyltransferase [Oscillospiraceae bacterium]|jgi:molybdopterin-guanine dinucleotide biosynthesis protein A|nr:molybdenum cofactor guanylyltransferase [Oscillospiraceae bacterium]